MNNLRMWAYAMIATGLINWDYQRAKPSAAIHSFAIVTPGLILLIATLIPSLQPFLTKKSVRFSWLLIGALVFLYAFMN